MMPWPPQGGTGRGCTVSAAAWAGKRGGPPLQRTRGDGVVGRRSESAKAEGWVQPTGRRGGGVGESEGEEQRHPHSTCTLPAGRPSDAARVSRLCTGDAGLPGTRRSLTCGDTHGCGRPRFFSRAPHPPTATSPAGPPDARRVPSRAAARRR